MRPSIPSAPPVFSVKELTFFAACGILFLVEAEKEGGAAMTDIELQRAYLYQPFVPVLLGGRGRDAVRMAARIYRRHRVVSHWFGHGRTLGLGHLKRHALPSSADAISDEALTRMLMDFAHEKEATGGFLSLLPCTPDAEAYLHRAHHVLETAYVLLPPPGTTADPLRGLISPLSQARNA